MVNYFFFFFQVWSLANCKLKINHSGHTGYLNTVTVSPDGSLCASGGKVIFHLNLKVLCLFRTTKFCCWSFEYPSQFLEYKLYLSLAIGSSWAKINQIDAKTCFSAFLLSMVEVVLLYRAGSSPVATLILTACTIAVSFAIGLDHECRGHIDYLEDNWAAPCSTLASKAHQWRLSEEPITG